MMLSYSVWQIRKNNRAMVTEHWARPWNHLPWSCFLNSGYRVLITFVSMTHLKLNEIGELYAEQRVCICITWPKVRPVMRLSLMWRLKAEECCRCLWFIGRHSFPGFWLFPLALVVMHHKSPAEWHFLFEWHFLMRDFIMKRFPL